MRSKSIRSSRPFCSCTVASAGKQTDVGVKVVVDVVVVVVVDVDVVVVVVVDVHDVSLAPEHEDVTLNPGGQEEQLVHVLLSVVAAQKREIYSPGRHAVQFLQGIGDPWSTCRGIVAASL